MQSWEALADAFDGKDLLTGEAVEARQALIAFVSDVSSTIQQYATKCVSTPASSLHCVGTWRSVAHTTNAAPNLCSSPLSVVLNTVVSFCSHDSDFHPF